MLECWVGALCGVVDPQLRVQCGLLCYDVALSWGVACSVGPVTLVLASLLTVANPSL